MRKYNFSKKEEADSLKRIEIYWLKKHGYLYGYKYSTIEWTHGWSGTKSSIGIQSSVNSNEQYIRFIYTQINRDTGEEKDFDYKVQLSKTSCNYGGARYWFICPLYRDGVSCGKRVGVLYKNGNYFGCRHCYGLTYSSRKKNKSYKYYSLFRVLNLSDKIEDLEAKIKRPYYNGNPTKKQKKLNSMHKQFISSSILLNKTNKL